MFPLKGNHSPSSKKVTFFFSSFDFIWFHLLKTSILSLPLYEQREEPWLATSLRPENFVPGLLIGFLLGLFLDLSSARRSGCKGKSSSVPGKQRSLASDNGGEELKMVCLKFSCVLLFPGHLFSGFFFLFG